MNGEMHLLLENDFIGLPSFELLEYWVTVGTVYYQVGGIFAIDESRRCGCFPSLFYHDPPCKAIKPSSAILKRPWEKKQDETMGLMKGF